MIPHYKGNIPFITAHQMQKVDQDAEKKYGISLTQMMENAGLNLALLASYKFFNHDVKDKTILVAAGSGGNGGGAMVAARRLYNRGARVKVILSTAKHKLIKETLKQYNTLLKLQIPVIKSMEKADLIIDGMIGYSLSGKPEGKVAGLIKEINNSNIPLLSLDTPSGLNLNNGKPESPVIKATATMTLALPKIGLFKSTSSHVVGDLYLADIGLPPEIYKPFVKEYDVFYRVFRESTVVRINKMIVFS